MKTTLNVLIKNKIYRYLNKWGFPVKILKYDTKNVVLETFGKTLLLESNKFEVIDIRKLNKNKLRIVHIHTPSSVYYYRPVIGHNERGDPVERQVDASDKYKLVHGKCVLNYFDSKKDADQALKNFLKNLK